MIPIEPVTMVPTFEGPSPLEAFPEGRGLASMPHSQSILGEFGRMVGQGIGAVNHDLLAAQTDLQRLATGDVQNLHQIMIRLEESHLSFQLFMQVRNRLLEAYQDIMKMQV